MTSSRYASIASSERVTRTTNTMERVDCTRSSVPARPRDPALHAGRTTALPRAEDTVLHGTGVRSLWIGKAASEGTRAGGRRVKRCQTRALETRRGTFGIAEAGERPTYGVRRHGRTVLGGESLTRAAPRLDLMSLIPASLRRTVTCPARPRSAIGTTRRVSIQDERCIRVATTHPSIRSTPAMFQRIQLAAGCPARLCCSRPGAGWAGGDRSLEVPRGTAKFAWLRGGTAVWGLWNRRAEQSRQWEHTGRESRRCIGCVVV